MVEIASLLINKVKGFEDALSLVKIKEFPEPIFEICASVDGEPNSVQMLKNHRIFLGFLWNNILFPTSLSVCLSRDCSTVV